jgi:polysaccharide biosynthesis protein PslG
MRRLSCLAALVGLLSVGALGTAGPATAAGPPEFFGLVPQGAEPPDADIERMGEGNVGTVRLVVNWTVVEQTDDAFSFGALDAYVGDLAASGIRPFPVLFGTAPFVNSDPVRLPVDSAKDKEEWQEFVRTAVKRYGAGGEYWSTQFPIDHPGAEALPIKTWQIWNEQNAPKYTHPKPSTSAYGQLLDITHSAITGVDPNAEIVLGGMFGTPRGKGSLKAWTFLKRLYTSPGAKESFDGVALHPYSPDIAGIKE